MRLLSANEAMEERRFFEAAGRVASRSTCLRDRCGAVIVKNGEIIGEGYNSPPLGNEANRACEYQYKKELHLQFDRTCCVHAEWRAILDACKRNPDKILGSRLYYMRLDKQGGLTRAGDPYCTTCSRLTMEAGVAEFALWQEQGVAVWPLDEFDRESRGSL